MSVEIRNKIINELKNKNNYNIAIAMHNSPDGDSIGSAMALERALLKLGKNVDVILQDKISPSYECIVGKHRVNKLFIPNANKQYDLMILLDCSDIYRTVDNVEHYAKKMITIDHHPGCTPIGDIYLYENESSTGIIIYKIIKNMILIDDKIATFLYLTIRSDTSGFKNNNTNANSHKITSELLNKGANIQTINEIYENKSLSLIRLMGQVFQDVLYDKQYKLIYLIVKADHIKKANATYEEASMLIDYIRYVNDSDIAFLFLENNDNIRVKARSINSNVSKIMNKFGGGGHPNAAGAQIYTNNVYKTVESIINYTKECMDNKTI